MSGSGAPSTEPPDGSRLRVAVVAGRWHSRVVEGLLAGARAALRDCRVPEPTVCRVPGAFELPVAAQALARTHDAVVALGVVVRGGTPHFEFVSDAATTGLARVALDTGTAIGFGLLTCDDDEQALDRAGLPGSREDKGREAVLAAVETALLLQCLRRGDPLPG